MFRLRSVLALGAAVLAMSTAYAGKPGGETKDWSITVGAGGLYSPDYEGSDDYQFRGLPYLAVSYQDWLTFAVPDGLRVALLNEGGFKAGVLAGYQFDRDAGDNLALAGWGDVDGAVELGAFAEYRHGPFKLDFDVRHDVTDAHDGTTATLGAKYMARLGWAMLTVGPSVTWADDNYTQTYFGVTPAQSAAAVLATPAYVAKGGIKEYGLSATMVVPLNEQWAITGLAGVSQLTGDAADSPIVALRGSETQFTAGLFLGYRF